MMTLRAVKFAAAIVLALGAAACSSNKDNMADGAAGGFGAGGAATPGSAQDFVVNVGDRVFFETDSTDLTPTAAATLDKQAQWLSRYPNYAFLVEGHADERGTREYNFSLSARRAQNVRDYLISRGVNGARFKTISYGKERPVDTRSSAEGWAINRNARTNFTGSSE